MNWWHRLLRRAKMEEQLDKEMQFHLDQHICDLIAKGHEPKEAIRLARLSIGGPEQVKEKCRDARGTRWLEGLVRDLKYALRMLRQRIGFTIISVLTLALGIGATSAVFSLIQGVLLTPPPYAHPEQLVLIPSVRTDGQESTQGWSASQWTEWQRQAKSFDNFAGYSWTFNFLVQPEGSESMEGLIVTKDYFSTLGLKPMLGSVSVEGQDGIKSPWIVLGYELWQRRFNSDPGIVGKTVNISRQKTPLTVIGVMPPGIRFLPVPGASKEPNYNVNAPVDFWMSFVLNQQILNDPFWNVVGRLKPGTTPESAQAELRVIVSREAQTDKNLEGVIPKLQSLTAESNRDGRRILLPLFGAAALVLLIACGNAAALLLVRGLQRQQEYAVRCALGAGRATLFRQVSTESLVLALVGGVFGIGLAIGIVKVFKVIGGHAIPRLDAVSTGWPVLMCGLAAAILAAALAGLFPAFRASRLDPMQTIKSDGPNTSAGRGERRLLRGVVITQTALTLSLLVGAGLLIRTMNNLASVQTGYDIGHILTLSVTSVEPDSEKRTNFHRYALERVSRVPGVQAAAFAWGVPLTGNSWPVEVDIEGQPEPAKPSDKLSFPVRSVTEDYFRLLNLQITQGREFRSTDDGKEGSPNVAIVNQAFVDRYFPNQNPIGRKLWFNGRQKAPHEITGVVTNGRTDDLTKAAEPEIYLCMWQATPFTKHLVVRTTADHRSMIVAVQRELHAVEPTASVEFAKTLEQIRSDSLASRSFAMQLLVGFSVVASILTLIGIYGVLSLSVTARRREIAIRSAIGAGRSEILSLVLGEGLKLITGGVIAGLAIALALSWVLKSFLYGIQPTDPVTLVVVAILFATVALFACWVPARRASKVDPMVALRSE
ncbi:MAG TPA: ABC transporter permease [Blastocatellia bacterium]|nr:ABC transporter permease [Blastocatellia bacterium]